MNAIRTISQRLHSQQGQSERSLGHKMINISERVQRAPPKVKPKLLFSFECREVDQKNKIRVEVWTFSVLHQIYYIESGSIFLFFLLL